jgi:hypothetical protein
MKFSLVTFLVTRNYLQKLRADDAVEWWDTATKLQTRSVWDFSFFSPLGVLSIRFCREFPFISHSHAKDSPRLV